MTHRLAKLGLAVLIVALSPIGPFAQPRIAEASGPGTITTVVGNGSFGSPYLTTPCLAPGDGGSPTGPAVNLQPSGIAADGAGDILINDSNAEGRFREVYADTGTIGTVIGDGPDSFAPGTCNAADGLGDGGPATRAVISASSGLQGPALDGANNVYIADFGHYRIRVVDGAAVIHTAGGNGTRGESGDGGPATAANIWDPLAVVADSRGAVYFVEGATDSNNPSTPCRRGNRVRKIAPGGVISTVAGTGCTPTSGDGGPATNATFQDPVAVAVDSADNVYIADRLADRIREVDATGTITTYAQFAAGTHPTAMTFDGANNLFVSTEGKKVLLDGRVSGAVSVVAGTGVGGFSGDGGPATSAKISDPVGLAVDRSGNLLFADYGNARIRQVEGIAVPPIGRPTVALALPETRAGGSPDEDGTTCSTTRPVNCASGEFWHTFSDVSWNARGMPINFARTYSSLGAATSGPFGYGWTDSYNMSLVVNPDSTVSVNEENGSVITASPSGGSLVFPPRVFATLAHNGDGTYTFTRRHGIKDTFSSSGQLTAIQDRNGYTTTLAYTAGRLTTITDALSRALTLAYGANGLVSTVTDPLSRTVTYAYDAGNNLTNVTDVGSGTWVFTYDGAHRMLTMTDPRGAVLTNHYDGSGRVDSQTDPLSRVTTFAYAGDPSSSGGGTSTVTDPSGHVTFDEFVRYQLIGVTHGYGSASAAKTRFAYDPVTLGVRLVSDPDGRVARMAYDAQGNLVSQIDGLGRTTSATYDSFSNPLTTTDGVGETTTIAYDSGGNVTSISQPLAGSSSVATTTFAHGDSAHPGDVTSVTDPTGQATALTYDANGNIATTSDPLADLSSFSRNALGWIQTSVTPRGNVSGATVANFTTTFTRNGYGNPTSVQDGLGHLSSFVYDADQNVTQSTDPNGHIQAVTYDLDNEPTVVTHPDSTTQQTTYTGTGRVSTEVDGRGHATTLTYDPLDRISVVTDALSRATHLAYNGAGDTVAKTDASGNVTAYKYDLARQLVRVTYSATGNPPVSYAYDSDGRRTSMADATGTTSYAYDSLGRLTASTDGGGQSVQYGHNLRGDQTSLTYPGGSTVTRTYDGARRLTAVADWLGHTTHFTYDQNSNMVGEQYPNSTSATLTYDQTDRLTGISDTSPTGTFLNLSYARDSGSRITSEAQTSTIPNTTAYGYDVNDRVTSSAASLLPQNRQYQYDAADNVTQITGLLGTTNLSYDNANQLTSSVTTALLGNVTTTFADDARGNRTSKTVSGVGTSYFYDQANHLTGLSAIANGVTTPLVTYQNDGDGLRQSKGLVGQPIEKFAYDRAEGLPLIIGDLQTKYVTGPGGLPLEQVSAANTVLYYHQDQLGSTRALTTEQGIPVGVYSYDPYGNALGVPPAIVNPFQFAGGYKDAESGLYYLRARYYDPATASLLTRDPMELATRQPYAYGGGNPISWTDPTGLDAIDVANGLCDNVAFKACGRLEGALRLLTGKTGRADPCSDDYQAGVRGGDVINAGMVIGTFGLDPEADAALAAEAVAEAGSTASRIDVTATGLEHIFERHLAAGALSAGKSVFYDGATITELITNAEAVAPFVQANGNLAYIVDAGRIIGLDRATGASTSIYTVIARPSGKLVTAFPGMP